MGALFMTHFLEDIITWVPSSQVTGTNGFISQIIAKVSLTPALIYSGSRRPQGCPTHAPGQLCSDIPVSIHYSLVGAILFFCYFPLRTPIKAWKLEMLAEPSCPDQSMENAFRFFRYPLLVGSHNDVVCVLLDSQSEHRNSVSFSLQSFCKTVTQEHLLSPFDGPGIFQGLGQRNKKTGSFPVSGTSYPFSLIADPRHG